MAHPYTQQTIDDFLSDRERRGCCEISVVTYRVHIKRFAEHDPPILTQDAFLDYLKSRYPGDQTRKTARSHLRAYLRWMVGRGLIEDWIGGFRLVTTPPRPKPVITIEEFEKILTAVPENPSGIRDRAIFGLFFYAGCRRNAIRLLRMRDVELKERWIRIIVRGKRRTKSLPPPAAALLARWLAVRPESLVWVFSSSRDFGRPIAASALTHYLPRYARAAGLEKRVNPHMLRHSHAMILADAGCSVDLIRHSLDYSDTRVTPDYIHISQGRVREATDNVFGNRTLMKPVPGRRVRCRALREAEAAAKAHKTNRASAPPPAAAKRIDDPLVEDWT